MEKKKKKKKMKTKSSKVGMIGKLKTKPQKMEMMKKALIPISFACSATLGTVPAMHYSTIAFRLTISIFAGFGQSWVWISTLGLSSSITSSLKSVCYLIWDFVWLLRIWVKNGRMCMKSWVFVNSHWKLATLLFHWANFLSIEKACFCLLYNLFGYRENEEE